ncbi:hypothetical protein KBY25_22105 [Ruegeria pomeroyi]|nr:hypothetical protein [Ruegeria pomeroyi]
MNQFDLSHLRQAQLDTIQREASRLRAQALRDGMATLRQTLVRLFVPAWPASSRQPAR